MKAAVFLVLGIAFIGIAYSLGPDFARYMKIKSM
jgi:hypothetical protein